jgi:hypothetical protein
MMGREIIDHKAVDMTDEETAYYRKLVEEFTVGMSNGKDQFRDLFDVDGDGCITFIHPPIKRQLGWGVLFFVQNLMINQRLRRMERQVGEWVARLAAAGSKNGQ